MRARWHCLHRFATAGSRSRSHRLRLSVCPTMAVPVLGPMTLSGFEHAWFFLFLLVVLGLIALYVVVQLARRKRLLRFANMELLESVAPNGRPAGGTCRRSCW